MDNILISKIVIVEFSYGNIVCKPPEFSRHFPNNSSAHGNAFKNNFITEPRLMLLWGKVSKMQSCKYGIKNLRKTLAILKFEYSLTCDFLYFLKSANFATILCSLENPWFSTLLHENMKSSTFLLFTVTLKSEATEFYILSLQVLGTI